METPVLIIFREDLKSRSIGSWILSHISGSLPPHRYKGMMEITCNSLVLLVQDNETGENTEFWIDRTSIEEVYHGYDNDFDIFQVRGLGMGWAPVRVKYNDHGQEKFIYIITGYDEPGTTNKNFYEFLTDWLS